MARLLRNLDYLRSIQDSDLMQIIEENEQIKLDVEQSAQAEMVSYLAQRYKITDIFRNTSEFDISLIYYAKQLVEYTETAFSAAADYQQGDRVLQAGKIYEAKADVTASAFDAAEWDYICDDKALFYVTLPHEEYDVTTTYEAGDKMWYENKVYTALQRNKNVTPTLSAFWGTGVTYTVTGITPDDTTKWTAGDNRNQQIVMFLLDITLYHLLPRISPRNIPDMRKERYNGNSPNDAGGAIGWLKSVAKGNVMADLPVFVPQQGMSMRYGNAADFNNPSHNMLW